MKIKYRYGLTNRIGDCLYEALEQHHFDEIFELERLHIYETSGVGQISRDAYISWLQDYLSINEWRKYQKLAQCKDLTPWLLENLLPFDEDFHRNKYAEEETRWLFETSKCTDNSRIIPLNLEGIDVEDDAAIALFFNLVTYPKKDENGRYREDIDGRQIPAKIAKRISELMDEANRLAKIIGRNIGSPPPKDDLDRAVDEKIDCLYKEADRLEKETVLSFIRIAGFECKICDETVRYPKPVLKADLPACPSCKHPICPWCANCYDKDPMTVEDAATYLASCDEDAGMAYCGYCGDWGSGFMLQFLRMNDCPLPEAYRDFTPAPRLTRYVTTRTVADLPELNEIAASVEKAFMEGTSGIIKVQHTSGEIWGIPERHPDGWLVTICYPDER